MRKIINEERADRRAIEKNDSQDIREGKRIYRQTTGFDFGMGKYIGDGTFVHDE